MGDIINFEDIPTWDKEFDKMNDKETYKDYEVVDVVDIEELKDYEDADIIWAIDSIFVGVDLGYYPTYCAFTEDNVITIYYDKDCPEDEKEDKYDRDEFIERLLEELKEN